MRVRGAGGCAEFFFSASISRCHVAECMEEGGLIVGLLVLGVLAPWLRVFRTTSGFATKVRLDSRRGSGVLARSVEDNGLCVRNVVKDCDASGRHKANNGIVIASTTMLTMLFPSAQHRAGQIPNPLVYSKRQTTSPTHTVHPSNKPQARTSPHPSMSQSPSGYPPSSPPPSPPPPPPPAAPA